MWLIAAVAIAFLVIGADRTITGAVRLATKLGISKIIIGATIVSMGTTAPEAVVSATAAMRGRSELALGNGVGSIICDTALIFGLCCLLVRLPKDRFILKRQGWIQIGAGAAAAGTIYTAAIFRGPGDPIILPRYVGVVLLVALGWYLWISSRWASRHKPTGAGEVFDSHPKQDSPGFLVISSIMLLIGLALVVFSSDVLVDTVVEICLRYEVPEDVLAVSLVAFGTSLPELATALASIIKGHSELLVGNILGADILNVLFVIGSASVAERLTVAEPFLYLHLPIMLTALALFRAFALGRSGKFKRWQGIPLLGVFACYYAFLFLR